MKKILWLMAVLTAMSFTSNIGYSATPSGFANTTVKVNAQVIGVCKEVQHGSFPNPLMIDPLAASDLTFPPSADQLIKCVNGTVFTVKISSSNGTALDQNCTSSGVAGMALRSASWPSDSVDYIFTCAGDTDGRGNFTGAGFSTAKAMGIGIKILAADAQAALAHSDYSDTVTMTISY